MAVSSFLQHIGCDQDQLLHSFKAGQKLQTSQEKPPFAAHVINELLGGYHVKPTLHRLLGDVVQVF